MEMNFFGQKRLDYIRENKPILYTKLKTTGKLQEHIQTLQQQAEELWNRLIEQNKASWGLTEQLKADDPMKWIGLITNLRETMRLQVLLDLIYN